MTFRQPSSPDHRRPIEREEPKEAPVTQKRVMPPGTPWYAEAMLRALDVIVDQQRDVRSRMGKLEATVDAQGNRIDKIEDWSEDTKTRAIGTARVRRKWSTRSWQIVSGVASGLLLVAALALANRLSCNSPALGPTPEARP